MRRCDIIKERDPDRSRPDQKFQDDMMNNLFCREEFLRDVSFLPVVFDDNPGTIVVAEIFDGCARIELSDPVSIGGRFFADVQGCCCLVGAGNGILRFCCRFCCRFGRLSYFCGDHRCRSLFGSRFLRCEDPDQDDQDDHKNNRDHKFENIRRLKSAAGPLGSRIPAS